MSTTVLYFLPTTSADTSPLPRVISRLTTIYNPSLLQNWSLKQRLFRSTAAGSSDPTATKPRDSRCLQIISLPGHPQDSYAVITPAEQPTATQSPTATAAATVISIPIGPSTDELNQLLLTRLTSLWQPRQSYSVVDGLGYQVGDFRMRVGEVRQGIGGSQLVRGVAIEIALTSQRDDRVESREETEQMIMSFFEELGLTGAKTFLSDREHGDFQDVRLWCRMLTLKS
ncbi:MAG: hypothetical protein LQ350_002150 [Teloschistes chrysophthalmus]|nr:MAG: hypothetical protein LQ350_002150 [Niorma chrysophthalma]